MTELEVGAERTECEARKRPGAISQPVPSTELPVQTYLLVSEQSASLFFRPRERHVTGTSMHLARLSRDLSRPFHLILKIEVFFFWGWGARATIQWVKR